MQIIDTKPQGKQDPLSHWISQRIFELDCSLGHRHSMIITVTLDLDGQDPDTEKPITSNNARIYGQAWVNSQYVQTWSLGHEIAVSYQLHLHTGRLEQVPPFGLLHAFRRADITPQQFAADHRSVAGLESVGEFHHTIACRLSPGRRFAVNRSVTQPQDHPCSGHRTTCFAHSHAASESGRQPHGQVMRQTEGMAIDGKDGLRTGTTTTKEFRRMAVVQRSSLPGTVSRVRQ